MVIWIASYPRSGNGLLRLVLHRCFGLRNYNLYTPTLEALPYQELFGLMEWHDASPQAMIERAQCSAEAIPVKTHDLPISNDPVIYIVRDGRASLASYQHYLKLQHGLEISLEDLILGSHWPGSWSSHVNQWLDYSTTASMLMVRYEELTDKEGPPLKEISGFLGKPIQRELDVTFEDLHALSPELFNVGHNGPGIELIERTCSRLFWENHGAAMQRLGYEQGFYTEL